jgi:hypothetical protein
MAPWGLEVNPNLLLSPLKMVAQPLKTRAIENKRTTEIILFIRHLLEILDKQYDARLFIEYTLNARQALPLPYKEYNQGGTI